jgi:hypothetical protein
MTQTQAHALTVSQYSDDLLEAVFQDLSTQNLRNYKDHETRWKAERLTAIRAERNKRNPKKKAA